MKMPAGFLLVISCIAQLSMLMQVADAGFLADSLPLKIVVTAPVEIGSAPAGNSVSLSGSQALTVVFSRPVIALGSDFGQENNFGGQAPFNLTCNSPGRFRWVTTAIARFDPDQDWPTDLDCSLEWNSGLTTYDGVQLEMGAIPMHRRLVTSGLTMNLVGVTSAEAENLTANRWDANTGAPYDHLPEVPPDGMIQLSFNYPVNLAMLQSSLRLGPGKSADLNVSRCQSPRILPMLGPGAAQVQPLSLEYNDTCAQVHINTDLAVGKRYQLSLAAGTIYNSLSGPLGKELSVEVYGLRKFTVPLRLDFQQLKNPSEQVYYGVSFRRLDMWLPHGLQSPISDLASQISICRVKNPRDSGSECSELNFTLALVDAGLARMTVPDLLPHYKYHVEVKASPNVLDGFGLPLKASNQTFWTTTPNAFFTGPQLNSVVAVLENHSVNITWHFLASPTTSADDLTSVASWALPISDDSSVAELVSLLQGNLIYAPSVLGKPVQEVRRNLSSASPMELLLDLDPSLASIHVVHQCCQYQRWTQPAGPFSAQINVVAITNLAASFVMAPNEATAWVTRTNGAGGPVQGATVWLYSVQYNEAPALVGKCSTDSSGACSLPLNATYTPSGSPGSPYVTKPMQQGQLVGVVSAGSDAVVVQNAGYWFPSGSPSYVASLVADRLLVRPGETLHVTGYLQQVLPNASLALPTNSSGSPFEVMLQISQGWDPSNPNTQVCIPANLTADTGSFHLDVAVPPGITMGTYSISLSAPQPPSQPPVYPPMPMGGGMVRGMEGRRRLMTQAALEAHLPRNLAPGSRRLHHATTAPASAAVALVPASTLADASSTSSSSRAMLGDTLMGSAVDSGPMVIAPQTPGTTSGMAPRPASPDPSTMFTMVVASMTVTVADPRPPTADLTLTLPAWVKPSSDITLGVQATSYLGTSVAAANMTITWTSNSASGMQTVVTDASGFGSATIPLSTLPAENATTVGDTVNVKVEWVGPTRELITQTGSVKVAAGLYTVTVSQLPQTDVPGVTFGLSAAVVSNEDGSAANAMPVTVSLAPSGDGTAECSTTSSCTVQSGLLDLSACQLSLPCIGNFTLTACTMKGTSDESCSTMNIGRNSSSWAASPLSQHPPLAVGLANSSRLSLGSTATIAVQSPAPGSSLLLLWGNSQLLRKQAVQQLPAGPVTASFPLGDECRGGCSLMVVLSTPRGNPANATAPGVPTSLLFDPLSPSSEVQTLSLDVYEDQALDVSVTIVGDSNTTAGQAVVLPRSDTNVTLSVMYQGQPVDNAEVTVIGVDKAVLDLLPYSLQDLSSEMLLSLAASLSEVDIDSMRVLPEGMAAAFAAALRRSFLDPWVNPNLQCQPQNWVNKAPVDMSDEEYFASFTTAITYMVPMWMGPGPMCRGGPCVFGMGGALGAPRPSAAPDANGGAPSNGAIPGTGGQTAVRPRQQTTFVSTPLFMVARMSAQGSGSVTFTAPDNMGTFVIRAYAVDGGRALYGSAETEVVVRRLLSLTPSLPRFTRVGDVFEAGVIVTATGLAPTDPAFNVSVSLMLPNYEAPLELLSDFGPQNVTLSGAATQVEVRFKFNATALGVATITFNVNQEGSFYPTDSLQMDLEIEGQQTGVVVATSFPLRPANGSEAPWQEGLQLPAALPGSGFLNLTAGVGYMPAVRTTYDTLAAGYSPTMPDGYTAFALSTMPPALSAYQQPLTPDEAASVAQATSDALGPLSDPNLGLLPSVPSPGSNMWGPPHADIVLNSWASWLASSWPVTGIPDPQRSDWSKILGAALSWRTAALSQLLSDAAASRAAPYSPGPYSDFYTLAWARLALGASWVPRVCIFSSTTCAANSDVVNDLSLSRLVAAAPSQGLEVQVLTALALQAVNSSDPLVGKALDLVLSSIRVAGRTAYVAAAPGAPDPADLGTQALALLLLTGADASQAGSPLLVQKLAAYVAQGNEPSPLPALCIRTSPMYAALVARALVTYDMKAGSTTPDLQLVAAVQNQTVLQASFTSSSTSPVSSSTPWDALPSPPGALDFSVNGTGEASIAAMLTFVPADLLPFPTYRGIWVEASIQLLDPLSNSPTGPSLTAVPMGSIVAITIQVTSPDDLSAATLEVLMPAGLEPLDPNLNPGVSSCPLGDANPGRFFWWWWWPPCPAQVTQPDVVTFHYTHLMAGTSSVQLTAVAATPGTFVLPPIKAYADQQPEVMGMTGAGTFTVCVECQPVAAAAPPEPKACPNNCSGHGTCRLDSGECVCGQLYSGADCSVAASA